MWKLAANKQQVSFKNGRDLLNVASTRINLKQSFSNGRLFDAVRVGVLFSHRQLLLLRGSEFETRYCGQLFFVLTEQNKAIK